MVGGPPCTNMLPSRSSGYRNFLNGAPDQRSSYIPLVDHARNITYTTAHTHTQTYRAVLLPLFHSGRPPLSSYSGRPTASTHAATRRRRRVYISPSVAVSAPRVLAATVWPLRRSNRMDDSRAAKMRKLFGACGLHLKALRDLTDDELQSVLGTSRFTLQRGVRR